MINGVDFLCDLLVVSEKAANIARICRQNSHLLSLLIQQKNDCEKNTRFVSDFKTLADVLVQEIIKYDLEKKYPDLKGYIYGEENNTFTNALGESVTVILNETKSNTLELLTKILDGDEAAAEYLTECVHSTISINDVPVQSIPNSIPVMALNELALWIDPIDSTAEYINGKSEISGIIPLSGLNCVTIIIGLFNRSSGKPVIGVMNQPFHSYVNGRWLGQCFWGLSFGDYLKTSVSVNNIDRAKPLIAVSSSENEQNREKLMEAGFDLISPAGAGYKILCVILGLVDAYVLSQGTTYYWDTCGCHAIINSLKGQIWNFQIALTGTLTEISYREKCDSHNIKQYSNKCGIIVSKDENLTKRIVSILQ